METLSIVVVILQVLGAVLGIVLRCYQLYKEARKKDQNDHIDPAKEKSEPSITVRVAHFDKNAIDIFDISIH